MRVLISAFAFSPYRGSECAVGWNLVTRLAKFHDVTVLCGDVQSSLRTRVELDKYFSEHPRVDHLSIQYVEPSPLVQFLEKLHRIPGLWCIYYLAYNLWQRKCYCLAQRLHKQHPFDLSHQLNFIGYREPGYLWKLPMPFVWGPVGGSPNEPWKFHSLFSWSGCVKVLLRTWLNEIQKRTAFRSRWAARTAAKLWAVTPADVTTAKQIWGVDVVQLLETGTMTRDGSCVRAWNGTTTLRIVWSGLHTSRKALPILLYALAESGFQEKVHVDILGAGSETATWKRLADKLRVSGCLTWHGHLTHSEALAIMTQAHIMAFPSLKEGTPHVVLEALSLGLPVICHDACGMGVAVTGACGVKVPLLDTKHSIDGFRQAIGNVVENPELIEVCSKGALKRAGELSWDMKAALIAQTYHDVVSGKGNGAQE